MGSVFISYRRRDTQMAAGRLAEHLEDRLGVGSVVIDVDTDQVGRDYREVIARHLENCKVVVALVGDEFLGTDDEGRRRIDAENDLVRMELARALERDVPVIPVTVDGAALPEADDLPDSIRALAYRGAVEVAHHRFERDFSFLADRIERVLASGPDDQESDPPQMAPPTKETPSPDPTPEMPGAGPTAEPSGAASLPPAGWHRDPTDNAQLRYWDGRAWTNHVSPAATSTSTTAEYPKGTTILVLGLVGLLLCFGLTSPFAWAMGNRARREMNAQPNVQWSNRSAVTAGWICGIIGTLLLILVVALVLVAIAADQSST